MTDTAPAAPSARIRVRAHGPLLVSGAALTRRRQVESEHGEPITWETTERLEADGTVALCRCGASSAKPFCDGTHAKIGFDGTEAAPTDTYDERAKVFQGTGITMRDDRALCEHAGFCGNRLTNVWKMVGGDHVADSITRAQVAAMVERCPSGALTYRLGGSDGDIEPSLPLEVGVVTDGPYYVTGGITVERSDGQPLETRNRVTLCRCGHSSAKPLCDGSHKGADFKDG